jgi:hypothetical protein
LRPWRFRKSWRHCTIGRRITVNAFLSDWYSAKGAVRFEYATIKGDLRNAHFESMSVAFRLSEFQAINDDESAT